MQATIFVIENNRKYITETLHQVQNDAGLGFRKRRPLRPDIPAVHLRSHCVVHASLSPIASSYYFSGWSQERTRLREKSPAKPFRHHNHQAFATALVLWYSYQTYLTPFSGYLSRRIISCSLSLVYLPLLAKHSSPAPGVLLSNTIKKQSIMADSTQKPTSSQPAAGANGHTDSAKPTAEPAQQAQSAGSQQSYQLPEHMLRIINGDANETEKKEHFEEGLKRYEHRALLMYLAVSAQPIAMRCCRRMQNCLGLVTFKACPRLSPCHCLCTSIS